MNKDTAKDYLPLVQALAEGKTIQVKTNFVEVEFFTQKLMLAKVEWNDCEPDWSKPPESYRIKPEPKKQSYRVGLFKNSLGHFIPCMMINEPKEIDFENSAGFVRWLTDRIEYTLPEGDA